MVRTIVVNKQKYKDIEKLIMSDTIKCLRTSANISLKMKNLLLTWISDQQSKGDNVNSILIRKKQGGFLMIWRWTKNSNVEFSASKDLFLINLKQGLEFI